jgi:hypothetical protein
VLQPDLVPCKVFEFDHLISKAKLADDENFQDFVNPVSRTEVRLYFCKSNHTMWVWDNNQWIVYCTLSFIQYTEFCIVRPLPTICFCGYCHPVRADRFFPCGSGFWRQNGQASGTISHSRWKSQTCCCIHSASRH